MMKEARNTGKSRDRIAKSTLRGARDREKSTPRPQRTFGIVELLRALNLPWHTCGVSQVEQLEQAVREIDAYAARDGWDGPIRIFSLVDANTAISANPELAEQLPGDATGLLSIEQEGLPESNSVEELLARIAWPEVVDGAAICLERVTLPPEAEDEIPDDLEEAQRFVANDPRREDIRMVVGVMRTGANWCTLRLRSHDSDAEVISGVGLVPEMVEALAATFAD